MTTHATTVFHLRHNEHGYLLLRSYKKQKGEHFQLPGGRIDTSDATCAQNEEETALIAAARELFEETGLDFRATKERFTPLHIYKLGRSNNYYYFALELTDEDSLQTHIEAKLLNDPLSNEPFKLRLSHEHTGFYFTKSLDEAATLTAKHSGGSSAEFLSNYSTYLKKKEAAV